MRSGHGGGVACVVGHEHRLELPLPFRSTRPQACQIDALHRAVHDSGDAAARALLVAEYRPNAIAIAKRLHRDGEPLDDLVQVALEALLLAIDRFDPGRQRPFLAFATPTIVGTLKRYYRDHGWSVRVPRQVHELASPLREARAMLEQDLARDPTPEELADFLGIGRTQVEAVLAAAAGRSPRSLDHDEGGLELAMGTIDAAFDTFDARDAVQRARAGLDAKDREAVALYFDEGMTQSAIARRLGCSQMQVSRMLRRAVGQLRRSVGFEGAA